jgi:hypothetical protein
MNDFDAIEWNAWPVDEPPRNFADRVLEAAVARRAEGEVARRRPASSSRRVALLAAAALVVASAGVLAAVRLVARSVEAPGTGSSGSAPIAASNATDAAVGSTETRPSTVPPGVRIDPRLHDDVRSKFERGLEGRGVERDPHTGLTIPSGAHAASSHLSREYIQAVIRRDFFPLAMSCYESALARVPTLRGRVVVDFMIVGDAKLGGIVDQARINDRSDIDDEELRTCLRESMLSMVFEAPENDGWVTVTYPFGFEPDDEAERDR